MKHIDTYSCEVEVKEGIPEIYGITMNGAKVVDLHVGTYYSGCRCCTCNDRNKYDMISQTIICKNYNKCLADVWEHLQEGQKADIREVIKMSLGER